MKRTSIGNGVYKDEKGFWIRPWVNNSRTWRRLKAKTERFAIKEAREKAVAQERAKHGVGRDPFSKGSTFDEAAELYISAECPNRRLEPRPKYFQEWESARLEHLRPFFGGKDLHSIKLALLPEYRVWRKRRLIRKTAGDRMIELEMVTLSNVINYAVQRGLVDFNYIRTGRPKFHKAASVRSCREFAPQDANELHRIAEYFFGRVRTEVNGWLTLFAAMTGCRLNELLKMRLDAKCEAEPGFISGNYLFIRRSKHGINPYVLLVPELSEMIEAFKVWHKERFEESTKWYFPGHLKGQPLKENSFSHSVPKAAGVLGLPPRRAHGLRSYFVTKRRSDGASDTQIAAEIGDQTASLIAKTYGSVPPNWVGQKKLSFIPEKTRPAWWYFRGTR